MGENAPPVFIIRIQAAKEMAFFKGQEIYSIDNKGRVNIPSKMRKAMSPDADDTFVVTRGTDNCIYAYPLDEWKKYEERLQSLDQHDEENRLFLRMVLMWSEEVKMDAQQRISLPKKLTDHAKIEKAVAIVGMVDRIEFWDPARFEDYMSGAAATYEDVAKKVMTV